MAFGPVLYVVHFDSEICTEVAETTSNALSMTYGYDGKTVLLHTGTGLQLMREVSSRKLSIGFGNAIRPTTWTIQSNYRTCQP